MTGFRIEIGQKVKVRRKSDGEIVEATIVGLRLTGDEMFADVSVDGKVVEIPMAVIGLPREVKP